MRKKFNWKNGVCIALTACVCFTGSNLNVFAENGQNAGTSTDNQILQDSNNTGNDQGNQNTGDAQGNQNSGDAQGNQNTGNNQGSQNAGNNQGGQNTNNQNTNNQNTNNQNTNNQNTNNQNTNNTNTNEAPVITPATSIVFKNSKEVLSVGETLDLAKAVTVNPKEAEINWESSNSGVVKVENGLITAVTPGTAVIKAVSKGNSSVSASCEVSVKDSKYYTQLIFPENELKIQPGEVETVTGVSYPSTVIDDVIKWESTNNDIATVVVDDKEYKKAYISGENVGTCYIVAKVGNGTEIGKIKVQVGSPSGLEKTRIIKESVPTITYLKRNKGSFKIKYKAIEYASGYQIKYKKSGDWITVNTTKKSVSITKLPKGVYKVKVRAYRNYDGKKYYGKYSNTRKIKVK